MKNKFFKIFLMALLTSLIFTGCKTSGEDVVAVVNGTKITKSDFEKTTLKVGKEYEAIFGEEIWTSEVEGGKTFKEEFDNEILNVMISQEIVYQEAEKQGITVTDEEVANEMNSYMQFIEDVDEYNKFMEENGIDEEFLKDHLKKTLIYDKYRNKIMSETQTNENELKEHYNTHIDEYKKEEIKASHILITTLNDMGEPLSEEESAKKEAKAADILSKINQGENFEALAKEYSDDKASAKNGGDLGYFAKGVMVPEFEKVAFELEKGQVSNVVKSSFGYHIIKVYEKREEITTFEEEKENILGSIRYEIYDKKMEELKKASKIEIFDDIINK
ncbi:peptidylprolyl isomerase [Proteocatella sphenisci]|uniref:peptidylprolyl isomerase n=1 Tax=Proteocatella sphenisci TaxID=181070 RepID=UPI0004B830D6|nr:peptidylprolyl isomerase [Proteocatella sphenisci]